MYVIVNEAAYNEYRELQREGEARGGEMKKKGRKEEFERRGRKRGWETQSREGEGRKDILKEV